MTQDEMDEVNRKYNNALHIHSYFQILCYHGAINGSIARYTDFKTGVFAEFDYQKYILIFGRLLNGKEFDTFTINCRLVDTYDSFLDDIVKKIARKNKILSIK